MLASDSDSDFEYPADTNNSDASDDCILLGKLALGIDPQDMKAYDGRSTPQNGSQYLMKVMAEKKSVPKVVSFDTSKLLEKRKGMRKDEADGPPTPHYLDKFLRVCDSTEEDSVNLDFLPSAKWREETISSFSLIRTKVERWQYMMESREIRINDPVELPQSNENAHWLKFCFGDGFLKLAARYKSKPKEEKLCDFFLDLYDSSVCSDLLTASEENQITAEKTNCETLEYDKDNQGNSSVASENKEDADHENTPVKIENAESIPRMGTRPLMKVVMKLNQCQLENLVKWSLLWVQNIGLINECQGQWLYAILACLFKPLDPSVISDFRSIARILIKARNTFSCDWRSHLEVKLNGDANDGLDGRVFDYINTLNLFIYVIADYFQQKDLVMKI